MPTHIIMPALGVAQQTGTLLKWLKKEGQSVAKGEPVMEIETDKATVEIEAPASGILTQVIAQPGDEVPVGTRIALILAPGESASAATLESGSRVQSGTDSNPFAKRKEKSPGGKKAAASSAPSLRQQESRGDSHFTASSPGGTTKISGPVTAGRILASPAAKRIARERGVRLATLKGSGPDGSILVRDVLQPKASEPPRPNDVSAASEPVPLSTMRRIVGERMLQSKLSAPHFYISMEIDMSAIGKLRREWRQRGDEVIPSINDFILLACARALKQFPSVNSSYDGQGIVFNKNINLGLAVALEEGLVVPVIRDADQLTLLELTARTRDLIDKAQKKKLFPMEYDGGTFTVSNLGMLGVDSFVAIINPPQCAILATGRIAPRVVAEEDMLAIRSMMTATLSADHRIIDGAVGARFLQRIKKVLEEASV
ncbi:MAG TPA: dihydrolipoamide acetyltransferase family protein [Candidatus Binatia bacterium]